jgi:hypothetical protein
MQSPGAKTRRGNEEDWLFDIVNLGIRDARPHPDKRASAIVAPKRTRVRASRRMRTSRCNRPHASSRRAAHASVRALRHRACAARLPHEGGGGQRIWRDEANESDSGSSPRGAPRDARVAGTPLRGPMITGQWLWVPALPSLTRGSAGTTIFDGSEEPTCGCRNVAPTRAPCFRPVLYRELRNSRV